MPSQRQQLRRIPAVEKVLQQLKPTVVPRPLIVKLVRQEPALIRKRTVVPDEETILAQIVDRVADEERTRPLVSLENPDSAPRTSQPPTNCRPGRGCAEIG